MSGLKILFLLTFCFLALPSHAVLRRDLFKGGGAGLFSFFAPRTVPRLQPPQASPVVPPASDLAILNWRRREVANFYDVKHGLNCQKFGHHNWADLLTEWNRTFPDEAQSLLPQIQHMQSVYTEAFRGSTLSEEQARHLDEVEWEVWQARCAKIPVWQIDPHVVLALQEARKESLLQMEIELAGELGVSLPALFPAIGLVVNPFSIYEESLNGHLMIGDHHNIYTDDLKERVWIKIEPIAPGSAMKMKFRELPTSDWAKAAYLRLLGLYDRQAEGRPLRFSQFFGGDFGYEQILEHEPSFDEAVKEYAQGYIRRLSRLEAAARDLEKMKPSELRDTSLAGLEQVRSDLVTELASLRERIAAMKFNSIQQMNHVPWASPQWRTMNISEIVNTTLSVVEWARFINIAAEAAGSVRSILQENDVPTDNSARRIATESIEQTACVTLLVQSRPLIETPVTTESSVIKVR